MAIWRSLLAVISSFSLISLGASDSAGATPPIGILTLAVQAHVDEAQAFAGLSVFDGEQLSTAGQGRMGVRAGHAVLTLGSNSSVTMYHITDGVHVDLDAGAVYFNSAAGEVGEVHVGDALIRTIAKQPAQAGVMIFAPKVLQVTAQKGGLNFSYHQEFRYLPEGQTYRIYLDAPAEPQIDAVDPPPSAGIAGKVAYFILGAAAGGVAAWAVHGAVSGGDLPISPAKP